MSFEAVLIGDLHLEKLGLLLPQGTDWLPVQLRNFQKACDYAVDNGIPYLIQPGDVFESAFPQQETVSALVRLLSKYRKKLKIFFILGNHDFSDSEAHALQVIETIVDIAALPHVKVFTASVETEIEGIPFHWLTWPYSKPPKKKYQRVIVAHQDLAGMKRDNGTVVKDEEGLGDLGKDWWLVGHIHKRQWGPRYLFPGTPLQTAFVEEAKKGFYRLEISQNKGQIKIEKEFVEIRNEYTLHNLRISDADQLKKLKAAPNYYRLVTEPDIVLSPSFLAEHPQVVKHVPAKDKKQTELILNDRLEIESIKNDLNPLRGLKPYLINAGHTKLQAKKGVHIVKRILNSL